MLSGLEVSGFTSAAKNNDRNEFRRRSNCDYVDLITDAYLHHRQHGVRATVKVDGKTPFWPVTAQKPLNRFCKSRAQTQ